MTDAERRQREGTGSARCEPCEIILLNPNHYPETAARRLRPWLAALVAALAPAAGSLGARFVGDREMRRVNRQFRAKDQTTDVLSFPGDPTDDPTDDESGHPLGDLLISVPAARRQAAAAGHSVERELKVLLLHGVLHCLGHDHETDHGEMERLERRLRKTWLAVEEGGATDA
jgi:probable rRNA maturation factor